MMLEKRNNLIMIGMSAAGKSTLGVLVAKRLGYSFIDTDLMIQKKHKALLKEIIEREGNHMLKKYEEEVVLSLDVDTSVISPGGSVIYSKKAMDHLARLGYFVFIDVEYEEIRSRIKSIEERGIIIAKGQTLEDLYNERRIIYQAYADITINIGQETIEETVNIMYNKVINKLRSGGKNGQ